MCTGDGGGEKKIGAKKLDQVVFEPWTTAMMKTQQTRNMCVVCRSLIDGTIGNGLLLPLVVEEIDRKRANVQLEKNKSRFSSENKLYRVK